MRSPTILERGFWPDVLGANIAMIGIQPDKLFGGLTDAEVYKLYFNSGMKGFPRAAHFNQNGQKFFTSAITPELFRIYENAATP